MLRTALYIGHRVDDNPDLDAKAPTIASKQATCSECGAAVWVAKHVVEPEAILCWRCHYQT